MQNDALTISQCVHFTFGRGREFKPTDKSVLLVAAKEGKRGGKAKRSTTSQSFEKVMIIQGTQEKSSELHTHIIYSDYMFHYAIRLA